MIIAITYAYKTAGGIEIIKGAKAYSKAEAEKICKSIESLAEQGYRITDVTTIA